MTRSTPLLEIVDLRVVFDGDVEALRGVDLSVHAGETKAIVGESGAGKSTLALAILGLVQPPDASGSVRVDGQEILGASSEALRTIRWSTVAMTMQGAPFDPVATVGRQIVEPLRDRGVAGRRPARARAEELADEVLLDRQLLDRHPHELSGGERRRASLAMALVLDPSLLVLDEPTAGLDPRTRRELLERIAELTTARGIATVLISHDLPAAMQIADRTTVLYAGEVVEEGTSPDVLLEPAHPYSAGLVRAVPVMTTTKDLRPMRGMPPNPRTVPIGCAFHPRCSQAVEECHTIRPALQPSGGRSVSCHLGGLRDLLVARDVSKTYGSGQRSVPALVDASLHLREGEAIGLIGPSGSGKSTFARVISGHLEPDAGSVELSGEPVPSSWRGGQAKSTRRRIQLIMQDPSDALSPRLTVEELVREPLDIASRADDHHQRVSAALADVGLPDSGAFLKARIHQLSGGQLQRIAVARALVDRPKVLVADEPTAMLDASEQARVLTVIRERQTEMGLGLVLISHDMALVRKIVDRIVVLDRGRVVESGPSESVSVHPASTTGARLVADAPRFASINTPHADHLTRRSSHDEK